MALVYLSNERFGSDFDWSLRVVNGSTTSIAIKARNVAHQRLRQSDSNEKNKIENETVFRML